MTEFFLELQKAESYEDKATLIGSVTFGQKIRSIQRSLVVKNKQTKGTDTQTSLFQVSFQGSCLSNPQNQPKGQKAKEAPTRDLFTCLLKALKHWIWILSA